MAILLTLGYVSDPNARIVFIRQTSTQLRQSGGLWDEAKGVYKHFNAKFREDTLSATFPSGAVVQFKTCQSDRDISNFDGGQYTVVIFDECQWHSQEQFLYLLSRIRSSSKLHHKLIATCNPLKTSFLLKFTKWYLDEDGVPMESKFATQRWFAQSNGDLIFGDSEEELLAKNPKCKPMTYKFIAANVYSNPVLMERNPDYVSRLENLKRSEKLRLLHGSWYVQEEASGYFKREWVIVEDLPPDPTTVTATVRAWDLAATVPSETNPDPDYTACVKMSRDRFGHYWIEHVDRFRKRTGDVIAEIIKYGLDDGISDCTQVVPRDAGAAGKMFTQYLVGQMSESGIISKVAAVDGHRSKLHRFLPFASAAENGLIHVIRGEWNDMFFDELEHFTGVRDKGHDDMCDCASDSFTTLARTQTLPTFKLPDMSRSSGIPHL